MHCTFLHVTGLLLMNNELWQSILGTYTVLWTSFACANSRTVVWLLSLDLCESSKHWLYYVKFVCGLMAISRGPSPPSANIIRWCRHRPWLSSSVGVICHCPCCPSPAVVVVCHRHPPQKHKVAKKATQLYINFHII